MSTCRLTAGAATIFLTTVLVAGACSSGGETEASESVDGGGSVEASESVDEGGSVEAFCASAQDFVDSEAFIIELPENFEPGSEDFIVKLPEDAETGFEEGREIMNALADNAPDEISDHAETAARVFGERFDALADLDPTDEEAFNEALTPSAADGPAFTAAREHFIEFARTECGIDAEGTGRG